MGSVSVLMCLRDTTKEGGRQLVSFPSAKDDGLEPSRWKTTLMDGKGELGGC